MRVHYKTVYWGDPDYKVGDDGSFWSRKREGKWKKRKATRLSRKDPRPGICVILGGKRRFILVHHLVLTTFVGPRPKGMEACHFPDRDVTNNHLDNLRWDTRKNNFKDRDFHGTTVRGSASNKAKLTEDEVLAIRKEYLWRHGGELARKYGVSISTIHLIVIGKTWRHV